MKVLEIEDYLHLQKSKASKARVAKLALAVTTELRALNRQQEAAYDEASLRREIIAKLGLAISQLHALTGSMAEVQMIASNALLEVQRRSLCRND